MNYCPFCASCGEYRFPMYNVAVSMVVVNDENGQLLLVKQYGKDFFRLVAGYVNRTELLVPGKAALTAVAGSIAKYTAALTGDPAQAPGANLFGFIREQLTRQKKVLG